MKKPMKCPVCDSEKFSKEVSERAISLADRTNVKYSAEYINCEDCGVVSDIEGSDDTAFSEAHEVEKRKLLEAICTNLSERGYSMSYLERAFLLPQRTISRWKSQGCSASAMALMNLIDIMPFLANIADHKFDSLVMKKELFMQVGNFLSTSDVVTVAPSVFETINVENTNIGMVKFSSNVNSDAHASKGENVVQIKPKTLKPEDKVRYLA